MHYEYRGSFHGASAVLVPRTFYIWNIHPLFGARAWWQRSTGPTLLYHSPNIVIQLIIYLPSSFLPKGFG